MVNQEHPASLSADRRTDGFNQSSLDQHRTRHRNATHRTRLKRAVNYALLAYRVVLTVEWTSVLLLGLHHLLTTKTRQNKATPLALLTDYVNDYISFQHLPSAVQPIARKARGLYSVIGFSLRVVLASEFIQVLVGACNACGSVKLDSQKSFASRVALKLWAGQSAMREWIGRLLVVRYVLEPFVIVSPLARPRCVMTCRFLTVNSLEQMQSTGVTAFILLGWSLSSSIAYFSLVLQDFYRGYAVIDELK